MARLHYDGLSATLGAALTAGGTSITFGAALTYKGDGTQVPTVSSSNSDYIPLSIIGTNGRLAEIVYLTAYTAGATTGTIARGQESTTAAARASGLRVVHGPTVFDVDVLDSGVLNAVSPFSGTLRLFRTNGVLVFATGGMARASGVDTNFVETGIVVPAAFRPTVVTTSPAGNAYNGQQYQYQVRQTDGALLVRMLQAGGGFMAMNFPPWSVL